MTIIVPVAVPVPGLPLPNSVDTTTFGARKCEQRRWAVNDFAPGIYACAFAAYSNALDAEASAVTALAQRYAAANAAMFTSRYGAAAAWVSGATYTTGDVRFSPVTKLPYRRIIGGGGTTDPSADATNWAWFNPVAPAQITTALVTQALAGGSYFLSNTTAQAAATNICLWSDDASNAAWGKSGCTVSGSLFMAPDGTTTANKLVESATNVIHYEIQSFTVTANQPWTFSRRYKASGRDVVYVRIGDGTFTSGFSCAFNLTTGVVSGLSQAGTAAGGAATMTFLGDGWWECKLSATTVSTSATAINEVTYLNSLSAYMGDGASGVLVSGAQMEYSTNATSRIPTTSVAATRAASVIAPQRVVLPAAPLADELVTVFVGNNIDTNVIDPNGNTLMGIAGPMRIDNAQAGVVKFQFINSTWRLV